MARFLAIYLGTQDGFEAWQALGDDERSRREQAGMQAWGDWMQTHAAAIVDPGGPLGKTKRADRSGLSDVRNAMAGYVVVEADSHAAAQKMFEDHPHFAIFPGDAVEVMEVLPIPGA
jgi:hypothetical protein